MRAFSRRTNLDQTFESLGDVTEEGEIGDKGPGARFEGVGQPPR